MRDLALKYTVAAMSRFGLFGMLMCFLTSAAGFGPERVPVSQEQALEFVMKQFPGRDADYYLVDVRDGNYSWFIFVDVNPNAGWEHECYMAVVERETAVFPLSSYVPVLHEMRHPPEENLIPLIVKKRNYVQPLIKPDNSRLPSSRYTNEVGDRVWAVIISGGINANANYPRYWNDCSSIFKALSGIYGIPKSHISVIMSDGTDSARDMIDFESEDPEDRKYISSPLDLDGDGVDDIKYAATRTNIHQVLKDLESKVRRNDHVFIFVADHGGMVENSNGISYICLWGTDANGESYKLYDSEFADWIQPLLDKHAIVNVVLGQCFSGGFVDDLRKTGCVVAASTTATEESYSTWNHSIFLNNWIRAIKDEWTAVLTKDGQPKYDFGPEVTMDEAFQFAYSEGGSEPRDEISPIYCSTPAWLGEELAFDKLPPAVELFIQDNVDDTGKMPNETTDIFYDSPSIWVRNEDDHEAKHENPIFDISHRTCMVYVRVHNRGVEKYEGGKFLHMYWAKASLNFSMKTWKGLERYDNKPTGGHFGGIEIPSIEAGGSVVVGIEWDLSQLMLGQFSNDNDSHHYCLLARIMNQSDDDGYEEGRAYFDVQGLNTQAQKNVTVVYRKDLDLAKIVYVRNADDSPKKYSLELRPRTAKDGAIYSMADIEMELSQPIYSAWVKGGTKSVNVSHNSVTPRIVKFTSPDSKLEAVNLSANQFEKVSLTFSFTGGSKIARQYTLDLIQRDETGRIVGGEAFIVETPLPLILPMDVGVVPHPGNQFDLTVNTQELKSVTWRDGQGVVISKNDTVSVTPTMANHVYKVAALTYDGELATGEISLRSQMGIESISPTSAVGAEMDVVLCAEAAYGDRLLIADTNEATCHTEIPLDAGLKSIKVNTSLLKTGIYVISYISSDAVVDSKKFTKK